MSERDRKSWASIKADPIRYAAYLARKSRERKARREYETQRKKLWRQKNPDANALLRAAHHAVEAAVRKGSLYKRNSCEHCRMIGKVEAHHHKGYAPEHWLDVEWLCVMCHRKADQSLAQENAS